MTRIFKILITILILSPISFSNVNTENNYTVSQHPKCTKSSTSEPKNKINHSSSFTYILSILTILTGIFLAYQNHSLLKKTKWYDYKKERLSNAIDELYILIKQSLLNNNAEHSVRSRIIDLMHIKSKIYSLSTNTNTTDSFNKIESIISLTKITKKDQDTLNQELGVITREIIKEIKHA